MPDLRLTARHALGICLLGVVVMLWVASSFLMRSIFGEDKSYDKPFLVTWINTGTFSLYLVPWGLRTCYSRVKSTRSSPDEPTGSKSGNAIRSDISHGDEGLELMDVSDQSPLLDEGREPERGRRSQHEHRSRQNRPEMRTANSIRTFGSQDIVATEEDLRPLTTVETAKLGCIFSLLWFAANYFGNVALSYTNVASFTIISSLSGFFTLALGSMLGVETFTVAKLVALVISIFGVILVATQDKSASESKNFFTDLIIGDILALVGAALYGCYTVFLKFRVRNEERVSMPLFFGFVGVFNLAVLWPAVLILNYTGLEPFELPSTTTIWLVVAANASITFVSDYLWVLAMLMTSPLVVTVGISMSIPLALLGDHLLYSHSASWTFFLGAILVFGSFIAINLDYSEQTKPRGSEQGVPDAPRVSMEDDVDNV